MGGHGVESDLEQALRKCPSTSKLEYERLMHEGQDTFVHYDNGYRVYGGRCKGRFPDIGHGCEIFTNYSPDDDPVAWDLANNWTTYWANRWINSSCNKCHEKCRDDTPLPPYQFDPNRSPNHIYN
jgi:hypothetical protein